MCFAPSNVTDLSRWNWDGDVIVQQPIVPSGRRVVGVRSRRSYDIDVREFLTSNRNAVMERVLRRYGFPHMDIKMVSEVIEADPNWESGSPASLRRLKRNLPADTLFLLQELAFQQVS